MGKDAVLASGTASIKTVASTVSKLQELQVEKEVTKKEIAKVIDDLKTLQTKFDVLLAEKQALESKMKKDEDLKTLQTKSEIQVPETKVSKADNKKEIITQYAKEEDNEKILGIIKEIDVAME